MLAKSHMTLLVASIAFVSAGSVRADSPDDFPLTVGSRWRYAVYDSLRMAPDTVGVVIASKSTRLDGTASYLWQYSHRTFIDTVYVLVRADTLRFVPGPSSSYLGISELVLPLKVGSSWSLLDESAVIEDTESVTVPAGTFASCFRVVQAGVCCNDYSRYQCWIKPQIGIVRQLNSLFISVDLQGRRLEAWQLLSYDVLTSNNQGHGRDLPAEYTLEPNFPNPFNPSTIIRYGLPHHSFVTLSVFNTLGQKVAELVNGEVEAGYHEVPFNASTLASGVYFYRLSASPSGMRDLIPGEARNGQAGTFVQTRSLVVLR